MRRRFGCGCTTTRYLPPPKQDADGKIPKDLGKKYGKAILEADGFAQARADGVHIAQRTHPAFAVPRLAL